MIMPTGCPGDSFMSGTVRCFMSGTVRYGKFIFGRMKSRQRLPAAGPGPKLKAGRDEQEGITSLASLLSVKPQKCNYYREKLEHIDFSGRPVLASALDKLPTPVLTEEGL